MNKYIMNIITGILGGLVGAALLFLVAFSLHWGGLDEEHQTAAAPAIEQTISDSANGSSFDPAQIYDIYADSVVQVVSTFATPQDMFHTTQEQQGIGSGFVVSKEGYILTNAHVVTVDTSGEAQEVNQVEVNFRNGQKAEATIVGYDRTGSDTAVLKVDPDGLDLVPAVLGDSSSVEVGEPVVAIGSPFGVYASSLTSGIVSATERTVESPEAGFVIQDAIQTDAAINQGNSGGPLFNAKGEVIGLNEQIVTASGGFEGIGFAVPINTAKKVMDEIIETGEVEYSWMGVVGVSVDEDVAEEYDLSVTSGALVIEIVSDGPSAKADIEADDVITRFNDQDISSMEDLTRQLLDYEPGDKVKITLKRGDETKEVEVELGKRPSSVNNNG